MPALGGLDQAAREHRSPEKDEKVGFVAQWTNLAVAEKVSEAELILHPAVTTCHLHQPVTEGESVDTAIKHQQQSLTHDRQTARSRARSCKRCAAMRQRISRDILCWLACVGMPCWPLSRIRFSKACNIWRESRQPHPAP